MAIIICGLSVCTMGHFSHLQQEPSQRSIADLFEERCQEKTNVGSNVDIGLGFHSHFKYLLQQATLLHLTLAIEKESALTTLHLPKCWRNSNSLSLRSTTTTTKKMDSKQPLHVDGSHQNKRSKVFHSEANNNNDDDVSHHHIESVSSSSTTTPCLLNPIILKILLLQDGEGLLGTKDLGRLLICASKTLTETINDFGNDGDDEVARNEDSMKKHTSKQGDGTFFVWKLLCCSHWGKDEANEHLSKSFETPKDFFLTSKSGEIMKPLDMPVRPLQYTPDNYQLFVDIRIVTMQYESFDNEEIDHTCFSKLYLGSDIPSFFDDGDLNLPVPRVLWGPVNFEDQSYHLHVLLRETFILKRRNMDGTIDKIFSLRGEEEMEAHEQAWDRRGIVMKGVTFTPIDCQAASPYVQSLLNKVYRGCNSKLIVTTGLQSEWKLVEDLSGRSFLKLHDYRIKTWIPPADGEDFKAKADGTVTFAHFLEALPKWIGGGDPFPHDVY